MSIIRIPHDGTDLPVNIIPGNWRYVKVTINDDLSIDMRIPIGMKQDMIHQYLSVHLDKILMEYDKKKNRNHQALPITLDLEEGRLLYRNGLILPYLGNMSLKLRIRHVPEGEGTKIFFDHGQDDEHTLTIRTDNPDQEFLRYCIMRFYKKSASLIVKKYVKEFSQKLKLPYRNIHITNLTTSSKISLPRMSYSNLAVKNQTTLWGRCTRRHTLKFDWKLAMLPEEVIQYIIVHELTHVKKMNHSQTFWSEVDKVMPEYKECRRWLDRHGKEYEIF